MGCHCLKPVLKKANPKAGQAIAEALARALDHHGRIERRSPIPATVATVLEAAAQLPRIAFITC
jgi:hypothetical protein